jgi:2'-5' RNA ligase
VDPFEEFLFHLTIGYLSEGADPRQVRERLRGLRECRTGTMQVERVDLVELPTDQRDAFPVLEPVSWFELAGR